VYKLSHSGKLVLMYMAWRHLICGFDYVTVKDMVSDLEIPERTVRKILAQLRDAGLLEMRTSGRRIKYRLLFQNFSLDASEVEPGVYLLDIPAEVRIPGDLTFRAFSILRSARLLIYTASHADKKALFKLARCTCSIKPYSEDAIEEARGVASLGYVAVVVYDSRRDEIHIPNSKPLSTVYINIKHS